MCILIVFVSLVDLLHKFPEMATIFSGNWVFRTRRAFSSSLSVKILFDFLNAVSVLTVPFVIISCSRCWWFNYLKLSTFTFQMVFLQEISKCFCVALPIFGTSGPVEELPSNRASTFIILLDIHMHQLQPYSLLVEIISRQ